MKKVLLLTLVLVSFLAFDAFAIDAFGSMFGNLSTAQAIGQGKAAFGGGIGIADATSFHGSFTFGLSTYMTGRLRLGGYDPGDYADVQLVFGADLQYQIWSMNDVGKKPPFEMAVGAIFEFLDMDNASVLELGGDVIGSYPFLLKGGTTLSPYGRLNIRLERFSFDTPAGDGSDSNLEFGFNGGVKWQLSPNFSAYGEFQLDGNDGLFLGLDIGVM